MFDIQKDTEEVKNQNYYFQGNINLDTSGVTNATYGGLASNKNNYFKLRNNVKTVLVTNEEDDWIFNLNIGNVMHL